MLKKITFLFLIFQAVAWGQDFSKNWTGHFSYNDITSTTNSTTDIYVAANNSIFKHSIETGTNTLFSSINGLSSEDIEIIHYSPDFNSLIIGYTDGLIEIINENTGEISSFNDIAENQKFPPNNVRINNLFEDNGVLYIATGFGIVQFNLQENVFADTFLISDSLSLISDISAVGVLDDFIIASIIGRGLFIGNKKNKNLLLAEEWEPISANSSLTLADFKLFASQLIARDTTNRIYAFDGNQFNEVYTDPSNITNLSISNNELSISHIDKYIRLDPSFSIIESIEYPEEINTNVDNITFINNKIYFSLEEQGFLFTENEFISQTNINPVGPLQNNAFDIDYKNGDLWICYGRISNFYTFTTDTQNGVSRLRNGNWFNIPYEDFNINELISVTIDPNDSDRVIFGSYNSGIIEYSNSNNSFTTFNNENSNIELNPDFSRNLVFGTNFDSEGNLWLINSFSDELLKRFSTTGPTNDQPDLEQLINSESNGLLFLNAEEFIFDTNNNVYIGTFSSGIFGYSPNTKRIIQFTNGLINPESNTVRALALDQNDNLWIGSNRGLRVLSNPDSIFNESSSTEAEPIIFLDEGLPQELLADQFISDIKVDSEDNKWISTVGGGVFQVSPDGEETLRHFTSLNSPLPSNNVTRVVINSDTNSLFFATDKGLVEFSVDSVTAKPNFDEFKVFPNPVRPEYGDVNVRIEGLTAGANIKFTDIEGNLVFETTNTSSNGGGSGAVEWDTRSFSGNRVASGVYLILITGEDQQQTNVGKLLIVR